MPCLKHTDFRGRSADIVGRKHRIESSLYSKCLRTRILAVCRDRVIKGLLLYDSSMSRFLRTALFLSLNWISDGHDYRRALMFIACCEEQPEQCLLTLYMNR